MNNQPKHYTGSSRTERFKDNTALNNLLDELSNLLKPIQNTLPFSTPHKPVTGIVGNPRSGTTVLLQWMASLDVFSYPTNLLTRFAYAPYIGALVQKILFDPRYDFHGDFEDIQSDVNFESDLGKSKGALACNEFQHFFRNYMPNFELEWLDESALENVDCAGISKGLASIENALGKPFVTKANILQFNIPFFASQIPSLFWIHIVREPLFNMQSIIQARSRYFGSREPWLSAKPKQYSWLKDMDVYHQVAGQVYFTEKTIRDSLASLPEQNWITIDYESFCSSPKAVYMEIRHKYETLGYDLPKEYAGKEAFNANNEIRLPAADIDALKSAYEEFSNRL